LLQPREACATATGDRACSTLGEAGKVAVNGHGVNLPVHYLRNYGRLGPAPVSSTLCCWVSREFSVDATVP